MSIIVPIIATADVNMHFDHENSGSIARTMKVPNAANQTYVMSEIMAAIRVYVAVIETIELLIT